MPCRLAIEDLNNLILTEGGGKVAQQRQVWQAERQAKVAAWQQQHAQLHTQHQQALLQDLHLLHLPHGTPLPTSGVYCTYE